MSKRANPTAIGAFVLGALALAVAGIVMFGAGFLSREKEKFILYFPESVNGLDVGAPVKFKGVQLGRVTQILLGYDQKPGPTDVAVLIELDSKETAAKTNSLVNLADRESMKRAIDRGLRARIESQSLVTGLLYIELGLHPDTPARYMQAGNTYMEIPTMPSNLEEIVSRAMQAVARISEIPFEELVQSFTGLAKSVDSFVNDPKLKDTVAGLNGAAREAETLLKSMNGEVKPLARNLSVTTDEAQKALAEVRNFAAVAKDAMQDGSPLRYQLSTALTELTGAARALRVLADYLEQDPQAIITGRRPVEP
jgi:paraquat-inducible protein B